MISPQKHRNHIGNPEFVAGDGSSPSPCALCLGGEDLCETNPISSSLTETRTANCAKQSQTWAGWDIGGDGPSGRPGPPSAKRAKRTQLEMSLELKVSSVTQEKRTGYPSMSLFYHSTIPVRWQLCETKPILGGACPQRSEGMPMPQGCPTVRCDHPAGRPIPSSYPRRSCLYWVATGNRTTAMERGRL